MQIMLGEDDAMFFAGVPRNIVVTVVMDDGKKVKFPYDARKSMASLYKDIRDFCLNVSRVPFGEISCFTETKNMLICFYEEKLPEVQFKFGKEKEQILQSLSCRVYERVEEITSIKLGAKKKNDLSELLKSLFETGKIDERGMQSLWEVCSGTSFQLQPSSEDSVVVSRSPQRITPERNQEYDKKIVIDSNRIEREDIVRCVALEARESSCELKVGGEYRILKVFRKDIPTVDGKMQTIYDGYEVVDDNSPSPIRTFVFPHEVVLLRKRVTPPAKFSSFEQVVSCAECGEPSALVLDKEKDKYVGECVKCNKPMEVERVKPADKQT